MIEFYKKRKRLIGIFENRLLKTVKYNPLNILKKCQKEQENRISCSSNSSRNTNFILPFE